MTLSGIAYGIDTRAASNGWCSSYYRAQMAMTKLVSIEM